MGLNLLELNVLSVLWSFVLDALSEAEVFGSLESVLEGPDIYIFKERVATLIKSFFHFLFFERLISLILYIFLLSSL